MVKKSALKIPNKVVSDLNKFNFSNKDNRIKKSKKKYIILLCVKDGSSRSIVGVKRVKPDTNSISVNKDNEFAFSIEHHLYTNGLKSYFLFDINEGQIHLDEKDRLKFNPILLKKIVRGQIIAQSLTRMTNQQAKMNIYIGFFFAIFGGLIGYLISLYTTGAL